MIIISGCSPSSYSSRYDTPKQEDKDKSKNVRFTSEDGDKTNDSTDAASRYNNQPEFDVKPVEDYPVDAEELIKKYDKVKNLSAALTPREKVLFEIIHFIDTPYKYGGESEQGIDCSAFTQQVFQNTLNVNLPRSASEQFKIGEEVSNKSSLKFGDLVFFDTRKGSYPGHVGIYIGEDMFAHASRSQGVIVSSLKSSYYSNRFIGARRFNTGL
ncbi:MAG: hypothetical protein A2V66_13100 [Ignavibacteria bacterium RBG_13_36_8]|nr:MAG: hypothetical protein A2V66_13100 [Ignavibacteria bacterium RBG_13_36_8]